MEKEGGCSSDPQIDEGRKQETCTHTSQHCSWSLELFLFWLVFNNSCLVEYRHEGCTVCHSFSVTSCALPPPTTSGEMGLFQTKFWTTSIKNGKKASMHSFHLYMTTVTFIHKHECNIDWCRHPRGTWMLYYFQHAAHYWFRRHELKIWLI